MTASMPGTAGTTKFPIRIFSLAACSESLCTYDSVDRLTQTMAMTTGSGSTTVNYQLDPAGNRSAVTGGSDAGAYTLNNGHNRSQGSAGQPIYHDAVRCPFV